MHANNIEDSILDTTDKENNGDDNNNFDDTDNDELYEYIDLITQNDIFNYTISLKSSINILEKTTRN